MQHIHTEKALGDSTVALSDDCLATALQSDIAYIDDDHLSLDDRDHNLPTSIKSAESPFVPPPAVVQKKKITTDSSNGVGGVLKRNSDVAKVQRQRHIRDSDDDDHDDVPVS